MTMRRRNTCSSNRSDESFPYPLCRSFAFIELAHAAVRLLQHRIPAGHDGFQFLTLQYYFLNNAIQAHEIPQWIPYMTQGSVATLWFSIQASMLQSVLLFAPRC